MAEESTEFTEPPCAAVANPIQFVAGQRRDLHVLEWEKELVLSANPISISPKDAIALFGPIIRSNSSVGIQDQVTKMLPANVEADGIDDIPDLNFKQSDKDSFCRELEPEFEAYPDKVMHLDSNSNSISSKVIGEYAEQQFQIYEDMEMELPSDKLVEKIDLEKSTLRAWK